MEVRQLPLTSVFPSPMNPRKTFDEDALNELADNIGKQGLLQPITVRPVKHPSDEYNDRPEKYEIVCGERRYRAFCKLSEQWSQMDAIAPGGMTFNRFSEISAIVREMTDDEAFDAMITENLQRKDVDPMEEAFAFDQLIKKGDSAEEIALRFGKSVRFVIDRVKLNTLIPELKKAVGDGEMPLSAAMIIAKLPEESQTRYFNIYENNYQGFSKHSAVSFVNNLFMSVANSPWYKKDDADFSGGCGVSCSECKFNTANQGCLFYEMKSDNGRCTNRESFKAKTITYILAAIDADIDSFVKKGEPLEYGKMLVGVQADIFDDNVAKIKEQLMPELEKRNLEVVDPYSRFNHACWERDEEKKAEMLKSGKLYRVLDVIQRNSVYVESNLYQFHENSEEVSENGVPMKVKEILCRYSAEKEALPNMIVVKSVEAIAHTGKFSSEPLTDDENAMMIAMMLCDPYVSSSVKSSVIVSHDDKMVRFAKEHRELWPQIISAWMLNNANYNNACKRIVEPMLDFLGTKHCPEEYEESKSKVQAKFDKMEKKAIKQLADLGYGLDGKPLESDGEEVMTLSPDCSAREQIADLKAKYPDAIMLLRVGDFYECFDEDAKFVSDTLDLTLVKRGDGVLAGFPEHAFKDYLPRLVKLGKRVAICEKIEE